MTARLALQTPPDLAQHLAEFGPVPAVGTRQGSRPGSLVDEVERSGLRGRGGGWFPTHLKLRAVVESSASRRPMSPGRRPVVIANGMEGEPASSKDAYLLARSPHLVLDGIALAAETVGATDAFIAVHRGSTTAAAVQAALAEREAAAVDELPIHLITPPARYVASEESALAHWAGDGIATPVYPERPFQQGAAGRPTLVLNVETLAHVALVARIGGAEFARVGVATAPGTTLVSVGGAVSEPGVVEVPTGTAVSRILDLCGGPVDGIRGYLTGGYGGGWVPADGFDQVDWDPDSVRAAGGVIGASVLWGVGTSTCPIDEMARVTAWMAGESAGQCGPCMFGLPAVAADVRSLALRNADPSGVRRLKERLGLVSGRGGCKHPDGTARFVASGLTAFDDEVRLHLSGRCSAVAHRSRQAAGALPVPPTRTAALDVDGRDFR